VLQVGFVASFKKHRAVVPAVDINCPPFKRPALGPFLFHYAIMVLEREWGNAAAERRYTGDYYN